jgi:hypothetical protein
MLTSVLPAVPKVSVDSESTSWCDWLPILILPPMAYALVPTAWPRWALMWTVAAVIFIGCKWLTWRQRPRVRAGKPPTVWQQLGYFLAWPGLDAAAFFEQKKTGRLAVCAREWIFAAVKLVAGAVIFFGIARRLPLDHPYLIGWVGMIGIVMMLHFGLFHLLSCAWRSIGIEARPLMNWPAASVRLSEFWGRRWNTAFRDLTHRFLFRPLADRLGARNALWVGFLFSGLIHDAVISLPADGGYGGPTLFFLLQAAGMSVERTPTGRRFGLGAGLRGWCFTMACLVLPAPLLFHPAFVIRIIVPFMHATGALS